MKNQCVTCSHTDDCNFKDNLEKYVYSEVDSVVADAQDEFADYGELPEVAIAVDNCPKYEPQPEPLSQADLIKNGYDKNQKGR